MIRKLKRPTTFMACEDYLARESGYDLLNAAEVFAGMSVAAFVEFHDMVEPLEFQVRLISADGDLLDESAEELVPQPLSYLAAAHILRDLSGEGGMCGLELRVNGELVAERVVYLGIQNG